MMNGAHTTVSYDLKLLKVTDEQVKTFLQMWWGQPREFVEILWKNYGDSTKNEKRRLVALAATIVNQ
jgi:hypothetical protein